VYLARLESLREHDLFLTAGADAEWLTGVPRPTGSGEYDPSLNEAITVCLVGENGPVFSAGHSLWHLQAGQAMRLWGTDEYVPGSDAVTHLRSVAARAGWRDGGPIHVPPAMPFGQLVLLQEAFARREIRSSDPLVAPLRASKEPFEVELMRDLARRTAAGIREACTRLRPGVRRLELLHAAREEILAQGLADVIVVDLWAIGPGLAVDWMTSATRNENPRLEPPCSISIDVGAAGRSGYRSDVGRTIFVGEPPPRSAEALAVLREARAAGAPSLAPGRQAREVDDVTRAVIAERGFGPGQWIPSGHGIGLELHEPPVLGEADCSSLADGNVVSYELAIWQDGVAGAFAEDTVVVREGGPDWLIDDGGDPLAIV
jgi:Xaa-Pro aminopeptidase